MVVVGQSESSEGPRQLRVNKKLSKAISSVSRSRFAKPRPNLPGAKRSDSNIPARPCKAVERTPEVVSQTVAQSTDSDVSKIVQEVDDNAIVQTTNIDVDKTIQEVNDLPQRASTVASKTVQEVDNATIVESSDTDAGKSIQDICDKAQIEDTSILEIVQEVDSQTTSEITNTDTGETVQKVDSQAVEKIIDANVSDINEEVQKDNTEINCTPMKIVAVNSVAVTEPAVANVGSSPDPPMQKKNTVSNSPDKSSKYPQLTSLLTKKKNDQKKEAQKKMMRFKKLGPNPERSKMTMADLIYWNPTNTEQTQKSVEVTVEASNSNILSNIEEECVDDAPVENDVLDSVPKLVISEDGSINIDQSSLFISRNVAEPTTTEVVRKDDTTYSSFRKRPLTKHWNAKDTAKFYKALSLVGSDFSLMEQIFPHRTRRELKQKFKREEKFNIDVINRVLYETHTFDDVSLNDFINGDADSLIDDLSSELIDGKGVKPKRKRKNAKKIKYADDVCNSANEQSENEGEKPKRKRKNTKKSKSVEVCNSPNDQSENEEVCAKAVTKKRRSEKHNTDDDEFECEIVNGKDLEEKDSSKRQRNATKLPDGFVDIDCIDELVISEEEETNENEVCTKAVTKKRRTEKHNTDEDEFEYEIVNGKDLEEKDGSKRQRNATKLPDGFVNSDCIYELVISEEEETNENDVSEKIITDTDEENVDDRPQVPPKIIASIDFTDLKTSEKNVKFPLMLGKKNSGEVSDLVVDSAPSASGGDIVPERVSLPHADKVDDTVPQSVPSASADGEYITVDYIQEVSESNVTLLDNVMAFEVVTSQSAPIAVKRRRKINPVIPKKAQRPVLPMHLSSTNYTPVL